jgi:hypothetical protein
MHVRGYVPVLLVLSCLGCGGDGGVAEGDAAVRDGAGSFDGVAGPLDAGGRADGARDGVAVDAIGAAPADATGGGFDGSTVGADATAMTCPAAMPVASSACPLDVTGPCSYGDLICACTPVRDFGADGGFGTTGRWDCGRAPPNCPRTIPSEGGACAQPGQRCSYDFRACAQANPSVYSCEGGVWRFYPTPCS